MPEGRPKRWENVDSVPGSILFETSDPSTNVKNFLHWRSRPRLVKMLGHLSTIMREKGAADGPTGKAF